MTKKRSEFLWIEIVDFGVKFLKKGRSEIFSAKCAVVNFS